VLERRYLLKDPDGKIIETLEKLFKRVSTAAAGIDLFYDPGRIKKTRKEFYEGLCLNLKFFPILQL
jgi:ribonucleoside-diphosphate reductase alpha chain